MSRLRPYIARNDGYTLVELVVVIVIIGALMAIAVPSYLGYRGRATNRVAQSDLRAAIPAAEAYASDHGDYTSLDLAALRANDAGLAESIDHVADVGGGSGYCLGATVDGQSWSLEGPSTKAWHRNDDCSGASEPVS